MALTVLAGVLAIVFIVILFSIYLALRGRDFVILDAGERAGDAWRNRWDSLVLFTPARNDGLPGMPFPARMART